MLQPQKKTKENTLAGVSSAVCQASKLMSNRVIDRKMELPSISFMVRRPAACQGIAGFWLKLI